MSDYLTGSLAPAREFEMADHLDSGCEACRRLVEEFEADTRPPEPLAADASLPGTWGTGQFGHLLYPRIDGLTIHRELGRGGWAVVYLAVDAAGREVAVKLPLVADQGVTARFLRETEAALASAAAGGLPVYDRGVSRDGRPYFTMRYAAGGSLAEWMERRTSTGSPPSPSDAAALLADACERLAPLHQAGLIHRDLKPANLLLVPRDGADTADRPYPAAGVRVFPSDFGVARAADSPRLTRAGDAIGTQDYMSPELLAGWQPPALTARTDVYSLGVILFELLTGRVPHNEITQAEQFRRMAADHLPDCLAALESARAAPRALAAICFRCLEINPRRRYPHAGALADDLRKFSSGEPVRAKMPGSTRRAGLWVRRRWKAAAAVAVVVVVLLLTCSVSVAVFMSQERELADQRAELTKKEKELVERRAAGEVAAEREARLRDGFTASATLALQQGDMREALDVLARAEKAGLMLTPALRLGRARALDSIGDDQAADREIAALLAIDPPPAVRAQTFLLKGQRLVLNDYPTADMAFCQAEVGPLSDSDRAYLCGVRSVRSADALTAFRKAIDLDPRHLAARQMAAFTAVFLGRTDEARRMFHETRLLYPEHPATAIGLGLVEAARGNRRESDSEFGRLKGNLGDHPLSTLAVCCRALLLLQPDGAPRLSEVTKLIGDVVGERPAPFARLRDDSLPPCWRPYARLILLTMRSLTGLDLTNLDGPALAALAEGRRPLPAQAPLTEVELKSFGDDTDLHREGFFSFIYGYALFERANRDGRNQPDRVTEFVQAAEALEAAYDRPMLVDRRRSTLDLIVSSYAMAATAEPEKERQQGLWAKGGSKSVERFQRFGTSGEGPDQIQVNAVVSARGGHPALALEYLAAWRVREPRDSAIPLREAEIQERLGNPVAARAAAARTLSCRDGEQRAMQRAWDMFDRANGELMKAGGREMLAPPRPAK